GGTGPPYSDEPVLLRLWRVGVVETPGAEEPRRPRAPRELLDEVEGGGVGPMQVLELDRERLSLSEPVQEDGDRRGEVQELARPVGVGVSLLGQLRQQPAQ